jgi:hypothetical protein
MLKLKKSKSNLENSLNINEIDLSKIILNEQKSFNKKLLLNNKMLSSLKLCNPIIYKKKQKQNKSFSVLDNIFSNKFYNSEIPMKKGMKQNNLFLENLKNKKSKLNKSLILNNMNIYNHLVKVCRFWGSFSNYVYPIIIHDKYKIKKNKINNKNNDIKLPQLYTNSSKKFKKFKINKSFL